MNVECFDLWHIVKAAYLSQDPFVSSTSFNIASEWLSEKITAAFQRGSHTEVRRLAEEQAAKLKALQTAARERLRANADGRFDPALVDLNARLAETPVANSAARVALYRELAGKHGEVSYAGERPAPGADASAAVSGSAATHGLILELRWVGLRDVPTGLCAMTDWLAALGCRQFKYELEGSGWDYSAEEED